MTCTATTTSRIAAEVGFTITNEATFSALVEDAMNTSGDTEADATRSILDRIVDGEIDSICIA